jgi:hypothetical protein
VLAINYIENWNKSEKFDLTSQKNAIFPDQSIGEPQQPFLILALIGLTRPKIQKLDFFTSSIQYFDIQLGDRMSNSLLVV